jgi:anaerobic magnesium-protoporphyrin IX monomethyl ester cyclase
MATILFLQHLEYEFLGPMYLSAAAKAAGHECRLAFADSTENCLSAVEAIRPDIVGFSTMSGSHRWAVDNARHIKKECGIPNIIGGAHPTFFPELIEEPGVDMILRGEGEESVVELLDRLDKHSSPAGIPNIWYKNGQIVRSDVRRLNANLDVYPFPDRELYDPLSSILDRSVQNVITSRGCPWHCSFCFEDAMRELYEGKGKYVRIRNIESVLEECLQLKSRRGVQTIYFADDVFGMDRTWLYEFLPRYKSTVGLPFVCLVRADLVAADPEYAHRLAEGGCESVFFGIESGNEQLRNTVLAKQLTDRQIVHASSLLHEARIPFRTYNITGLPGETLEDGFSTVELNIRIKADYPWCSVFSPFPGTALTRYAVAQGALEEGFGPEALTRSFFTDSSLTGPHIQTLQNLQKFFQTAVLWPWTFPAIKRLVRLKPNLFFTAWFGLIYFCVYLRSERRGFWRTLRFGLRNYRHILAKQ